MSKLTTRALKTIVLAVAAALALACTAAPEAKKSVEDGAPNPGEAATLANIAKLDRNALDKCPDGLVLKDEACAPAASAASIDCAGAQTEGCEKKCKAGEMPVCMELARHMTRTSRDLDKMKIVLDMWTRQCKAGHQPSCAEQGCEMMYPTLFAAIDVPTIALLDEEKAAKLLDPTCKKGEGRACHCLAQGLLRGKKLKQDLAGGVDALERGCAGGSVAACTELGNAYFAGYGAPDGKPGVAPQPDKAVAAYRKACAAHDVDGCMGVAVALEARADAVDERRLALEAACLRPDSKIIPRACADLGDLTKPTDPARALHLYERGCSRHPGNMTLSKCCDVAAEMRGIKLPPPHPNDKYNP